MRQKANFEVQIENFKNLLLEINRKNKEEDSKMMAEYERRVCELA